MAGVYQRLLGLFLLDGGWLIRHETAIDDLLLHKALAEDAQILESLFGRAALDQRLVDLLTGRFQFGLVVLEALSHERSGWAVRGAEFVVRGHVRKGCAVFVGLALLEPDLHFKPGELLQLLEIPSALRRQV